jgi:hypothetical protein
MMRMLLLRDERLILRVVRDGLQGEGPFKQCLENKYSATVKKFSVFRMFYYIAGVCDMCRQPISFLEV